MASEVPARAQPKPPATAVKWSKELAGPAREDLEKALHQRWAEPYVTRNPKTGEEYRVSECDGAKTLPAGFAPTTDQARRTFEADWLRCRLIALMLEAKPATATHVGAFTLDEASLDQLPAALAATPVLAPHPTSKSDPSRAGGSTWRMVDPKVHVVRKKVDSITVESPQSRAILKMLGRGDLNGDGIEDLVLRRAGGGRAETSPSTEVFVITRRSPTAPLEVLTRLR